MAPKVVIAAGSDSDMPHLESLAKELAKFKIESQIRICSAHKQPARLQALIAEYSNSTEPTMLVGCAGGTDALSVVSCPPDGMNQTCLTNPPGSSNAYVLKPANVAKFAAQRFAHADGEVAAALEASIGEKIAKLEQADAALGHTAPSKAAMELGQAPVTGPFVVIAAGSDSDMAHLQTLQKELSKFAIKSEIRICSAHKQPGRLEAIIGAYNKATGPIIMVGCAGGTDALSGTASYLAKFPVVSCPPDGMNQTCLTNPPGSSNAFIVKPANVAKFAAQMLAHADKEIASALDASIAEKIAKLEQADEQLVKRARTA